MPPLDDVTLRRIVTLRRNCHPEALEGWFSDVSYGMSP